MVDLCRRQLHHDRGIITPSTHREPVVGVTYVSLLCLTFPALYFNPMPSSARPRPTYRYCGAVKCAPNRGFIASVAHMYICQQHRIRPPAKVQDQDSRAAARSSQTKWCWVIHCYCLRGMRALLGSNFRSIFLDTSGRFLITLA